MHVHVPEHSPSIALTSRLWTRAPRPASVCSWNCDPGIATIRCTMHTCQKSNNKGEIAKAYLSLPGSSDAPPTPAPDCRNAPRGWLLTLCQPSRTSPSQRDRTSCFPPRHPNHPACRFPPSVVAVGLASFSCAALSAARERPVKKLRNNEGVLPHSDGCPTGQQCELNSRHVPAIGCQ